MSFDEELVESGAVAVLMYLSQDSRLISPARLMALRAVARLANLRLLSLTLQVWHECSPMCMFVA